MSAILAKPGPEVQRTLPFRFYARPTANRLNREQVGAPPVQVNLAHYVKIVLNHRDAKHARAGARGAAP